MEQNLKSEGKCLYCGKMFAKAGINRHLIKHLEEKEVNGHPGHSFLVKIEQNPSWGRAPYFLSLWVDGETKMKDIDAFLRDIWLECCGHLSAFRNPKKRMSGGWDYFEAMALMEQGRVKEYEKLMENCAGEIPMDRKVKNVFCKGLKLEYEYDFGSSTELIVEIVAEYSVKADDKIVLLSRNEPIGWLCEKCGKAKATLICTVCVGNEESMFCGKCAKKHAKECEDFADYAAMPIVNSPRMGVCAYEGGCIDTERN
ncbi:hypothetical protein [Bacteroides timonensis]|uniref:hypothetical protein n=1 Tax=Bacteroides timonensis TaxID=1470345 RepID=UPI0004BCD804|nr:hypothetical protein [Bacteroides timonensis]